jgi:hypothetical protein
MRRTLMIVGFVLLTAVPSMAQNTLKIRIDELPGGTEDAGAQVRTVLLPMVSANPHFTLVSDSSWDLHLMLNCLYATTGDNSQRIGVNCADELIYQPDKWGASWMAWVRILSWVPMKIAWQNRHLPIFLMQLR